MGGHDTSGSVVGASGDVNGDGVGDLLIGARNADPKGLNEAGESYVVFGVRGGLPAVFELSSLNGSNGFILNGVAAEDFSSTTLASAGDLNADGFDDVVVGAQFADPNGIFNAGQAYVFFGAPGPFPASIDLADLDGVTGFAINGNRQIDPVASSVASGGDLNADGVDDLIIGADGASLADDGSFSGPLSFSTDRRLWSTTWRSMMEFSRSSSSSIRPSM
ncbi:MAG: integrin alpha [Planctomycetota bacterium]